MKLLQSEHFQESLDLLNDIRSRNAEFWRDYPTATMHDPGNADIEIWRETLGWEDYVRVLEAHLKRQLSTVVV